jgi:SAM-dependent methyltransferase
MCALPVGRTQPARRSRSVGALGVRDLPEASREGLDRDVYIAAATGYIFKALPIGLPRLLTSELVPGVPLGDLLPDGHSTCQDLERLTYGDASLDLVVTEDVLEHVRNPDACLDEIYRVLRSGGQHIFTVPLRLDRPTLVRVDTSGPEDVLLMEEEWHGDHVRGRILAYRTFGYDIFDQLRTHGFESNLMLPTTANRRAGIHDSAAIVATKV